MWLTARSANQLRRCFVDFSSSNFQESHKNYDLSNYGLPSCLLLLSNHIFREDSIFAETFEKLLICFSSCHLNGIRSRFNFSKVICKFFLSLFNLSLRMFTEHDCCSPFCLSIESYSTAKFSLSIGWVILWQFYFRCSSAWEFLCVLNCCLLLIITWSNRLSLLLIVY